MAVFDVSDVHLSYTDLGSSTRTIVLIHGHPFNRTMWRPQFEVLQKDYRIIAPDLRGYGNSPLPEDSRETRLETFAADTLGLADVLGVRKFALVGFSMGGQIALEIFRQCPWRIEALLLANTFSGLDSMERRQWRLATADRLERDGMKAYAHEELAKMIAPANVAAMPKMAAHVMEMMITTPPRGAAAALRGRSQRVDYTPVLKDIHVPTLIIVGSEDVYTPLDQAERLHHAVRGSKLAIIGGAAHMPNLERPDTFNKELESWITSATLQ